MTKDYYNTLGVDRSASQDEIKRAYRKLAHQHHPDKHGGDDAKFKEINEAYQVLSDETKKSQYDQFGSTFDQSQGPGGGGFGDFASGYRTQGAPNMEFGDLGGIFDSLFGATGGGRARRAKARQGQDMQISLAIDFEQAYTGVEKEISLSRFDKCEKCRGNGAEPGTPIETCNTCKGQGQVTQARQTILGAFQTTSVCPECKGEGKSAKQKCSQCNGEGRERKESKIKVKIPAGIEEGQTIRLSGQGEAGPMGAAAGDLYINVDIRPSKLFERDGADLYSKVPISYTQAALGSKLEIEGIEGKIKLDVPDGTQSGEIIRLKGEGMPIVNRDSRGDHYVKLEVITPKRVSAKERKVLEELSEFESQREVKAPRKKKRTWRRK